MLKLLALVAIVASGRCADRLLSSRRRWLRRPRFSLCYAKKIFDEAQLVSFQIIATLAGNLPRLETVCKIAL